MQNKIVFLAKNMDDAMTYAVEQFSLPSDKIFLNVIEENEEGLTIEALVDVILTLEGKRYIEGMLQGLGITYQLEARSINNETEILYNIHTSSNSILIGTHGKTLEAMQTLVRQYLQYYSKEPIIVSIDVGSYKESRKAQLEILATKTAKTVAKTKVPVKLRPMSSFERRIIHNKLGDWRDVVTESEGTGAERAIMIKPRVDEAKKGEKSQ